ncbi:MAG: LL-diaminopimelate aminotransferase [Thermaerobacter sp.]|nr:LL-diaminopimelate aminotransferase [Thermaerobacter sp.]
MKPAVRMEKIPPYLFLELDRLVERETAQGHDIINLGIGDPDQPTPGWIVEAMKTALDRSANHRYPNYLGSLPFRQAISRMYRTRFGVALDAASETVALIGSKEGIAHMIWAFAGPGDIVLVPDPAYPVYSTQTILSGAEPYLMPLTVDQGFLPNLQAIPNDVRRRATMLWLNYPNNPTGAVAPREFLAEAVAFCRDHDILLCSDAAYAEIGYDGYTAPSVLEIDGAKDVAIEFYSLSKPFNMTGWRIGAAVGNALAVGALGTMKSNIDSGAFTAVQDAAVAALDGNPQAFFGEMNRMYRERRDLAVTALHDMGFQVPLPKSTFYIWFPTPFGLSSAQASRFFVENAQVVVTPGSAYGPQGEGWLRISLTIDTLRLAAGLARMKAAMQSKS